MSIPPITATQHPARIVFLSPMCVLDVVSGAALDVRGMLETLSAAGHSVQAYTASLFDANGEVDFAPYLGRGAALPENRGKVARISVNDVAHNIFMTASSQGRNITKQELQAIAVGWHHILDTFRPQIVITFGDSQLSRHMQDAARRAGAKMVFFQANVELEAKDLLKPGDLLVTPSRFLAERYRPLVDSAPRVLHSVIDASRYLQRDEQVLTRTAGLHRTGLVTFINPIPHKGLTLFTRLAQRAMSERPEITFAVLEGRMTQELVRKLGIDLPSFSNVWWLPAQRNMRAVYRRTTVLLVPSFCQEGLARSVPEAHLSGIPVLASDRGGLPEAYAEAGCTLPIPEQCVENMNAYPDDETVDIWWRALTMLWDDDDAYLKAAERARQCAAKFAPERTRTEIRDYFEEIASKLETF